jgi:hypothetical protein
MFPVPVFAPWQIGVIALAASILTTILSWFVERVVPWIAGLLKHPLQIDLGRFIKTILLFLICVALAFWWFPFTVPAWPALSGLLFPAQMNLLWVWIGALIVAMSPYIGGALGIYNLVLTFVLDPDKRVQPIKDLLGWLLAQFQPRPPA